jgi:hypothetical protein
MYFDCFVLTGFLARVRREYPQRQKNVANLNSHLQPAFVVDGMDAEGAVLAIPA